MSDYGALRDQVLKRLKQGEAAAIGAIRGATEQGLRESGASTELGLRRQGITGAVGSALEARNRARAAQTAGQQIGQVQAQQAGQQANVTQQLGMAGIQEKLARDMALQQMIGNIISGVGQGAGTLAASALGAPKVG
jgi:hypothetical protein